MSNNSSSFNHLLLCANPNLGIHMFNTIIALRIILLLPVSTFVLYLGHQSWRQQRSSTTATHSDIFTYHVAILELIGVFGNFCVFASKYRDYIPIAMAGRYSSYVCWTGEGFFHLLTCLERYLAVVHPITYMGLRNARGVRIRKICVGCVWVLCFVMPGTDLIKWTLYSGIKFFCLLVFSLIAMSFFSLSVLCALIRPGPGEGSGEKERVDQSKQRAFYTITAISVSVLLWFAGFLVALAVSMTPLAEKNVGCFVMMCVYVFNLPSSLVSPLLYLQRAGKLPRCC